MLLFLDQSANSLLIESGLVYGATESGTMYGDLSLSLVSVNQVQAITSATR